jgi:hypothetical protein
LVAGLGASHQAQPLFGHLPSDEAHFEFSGDDLVIYPVTINTRVEVSNYLISPLFRVEKVVFSDTTIPSVN